MGFTDILRKAFPFLSIAASLGGPIGAIGASVLGKALNVGKPVASEDIADLLTGALGGTPEQRAAALQAENDFKTQMAELGFKDAETLETLANQDRASARAREIAVRDYTPEIGFYLLVGVFWYMVHYLFRYPIPEINRAIAYSAMGSIATLLVTAATYFYGTTRGSEQKSSTLASIATTAAKKP
jgi:hypothetical protein